MNTILHQEEQFEGKSATELAIGCLAIGTLFFSLFLTLEDTSFVFIIGFIFVITALPINANMFCHLLHSFYILPQQRKYIGLKIVTLLSTIPVAFLYFTILKMHHLI